MCLPRLSTIVTLLLLALTLTIYWPASPSQVANQAPIPQLIITIADSTLQARPSVWTGPVAVTVINNDDEPYQAQLARLKEGVTLEQFQTALAQNLQIALSMVNWAISPGVTQPGERQQVTIGLTPGYYILLCFIPGNEGTLRLAPDMLKPIKVVARPNQRTA